MTQNKFKQKIKKLKAFTMLEILMITLIIGIGLISIVVAITKAKTITNNTKQHIIATQLAREGVEIVYQIRNTNYLKYRGTATSYCRLQYSDNTCNKSSNSDFITKHEYVLSHNKLIFAIGSGLNIHNGIDSQDKLFSVYLSGNKRDWFGRMNDNQTKYGRFFRTIEGKGLYLKNSALTGGELIDCPTSNSHPECNNTAAKEFRFCSRVEYIGTETGSVEICGVLTNFN